MIRSLVLFVHIVGVLALFAGLAIERFGVDAVRRVAARISGLAVAVTVASGVYLGARFGVLGDDWMRASYVALALIAIAAAVSRRPSASDALVRMSLRVRAAFGLAVVFLMIAKPEAGQSLLVLGGALLVSVLIRVPKRRSGSVGLSKGATSATEW
jgi:hypothetical protein